MFKGRSPGDRQVCVIGPGVEDRDMWNWAMAIVLILATIAILFAFGINPPRDAGLETAGSEIVVKDLSD